VLQERSTCDNHQEVQIKGQIHSINYSLEYKLERGNLLGLHFGKFTFESTLYALVQNIGYTPLES